MVPYLVFVVTCGVPLFLLETTIGQYTQEGGITCWRKLCPLAEGRSLLLCGHYTLGITGGNREIQTQTRKMREDTRQSVTRQTLTKVKT